ncbi:hypothetical protein XENTR_v10007066 [Xenopus tropicalis]|nr:hypothetical protein XENTR_v10007066 [Xenopus tropicalis]
MIVYVFFSCKTNSLMPLETFLHRIQIHLLHLKNPILKVTSLMFRLNCEILGDVCSLLRIIWLLSFLLLSVQKLADVPGDFPIYWTLWQKKPGHLTMFVQYLQGDLY